MHYLSDMYKNNISNRPTKSIDSPKKGMIIPDTFESQPSTLNPNSHVEKKSPTYEKRRLSTNGPHTLEQAFFPHSALARYVENRRRAETRAVRFNYCVCWAWDRAGHVTRPNKRTDPSIALTAFDIHRSANN